MAEVAPVITIIDPGDGDEDVPKERPIQFRITDDKLVLLAEITVYVYREKPGISSLVFSGAANEFAGGYKGSSYTTNDSNGYDFTIVPDRARYWGGAEVVRPHVRAGGVA